MAETTKLNIFQRMLGMCATRPPADDGCWKYEAGRVTVDISRASELSHENGAIRLERKGLPERVLVFRGSDGRYHAFRNKCAHMGRRLDPVPGGQRVQCCSLGKSTYDYEGNAVSGMAKVGVSAYGLTEDDGSLVIAIQ
jgi:nitrite reductase/ring-hydroxylating ferredoxin subunit